MASLMESLLLHVGLFLAKLWRFLHRFLHRLGQQVIALGMAIFMPLGFLLELSVPSSSLEQAALIPPEATANLIYRLPCPSYQEVPQADGAERRGAMARRQDRDREPEWVIPPPNTDSVLLPDRGVQIQLEPTPIFITLLPSARVNLSGLIYQVEGLTISPTSILTNRSVSSGATNLP
jgi:hypothetical protein